MTRFWIVAPNAVSPTEKFEAAWEFDLANGVISIGWPGLGNVLEMSKDELSAAVARQYPDKPPQTKSLISNMLWAFYRETSPGDRIIARRGRKTLGAVGAVSKSAIWSPGKNPKIDHAGYLGVEWQTSPRDLEYGSIVFPMHTLTEVSGEEFNNLLPNNDSATQKYLPIVGNAGEVVEDEQMFVLEKYLEEFIVSNFDAIFQGNLRTRTHKRSGLSR